MPHRLLATMTRYGLLLIAFTVLGVFLLYPIALTLRGGFAADPATGAGWTLRHLTQVFKDPVLRGGLLNALAIAAAVTTLSALIALPLAVVSSRYAFPFKRTLSAVVLAPLILPPFVGAIGLRAIMGRAGALNTLLGTDFDFLGQGRFWGVVIVEALHLYPILYLNATAALANLDPALDEAAENLGASWSRRLWSITLPLARPGIFAGGTLVFIWSFTELGTPLMFDYYDVTPVQIFYGLKEVQNSARPYALTVVLLVSAVALYLAGRWLLGGKAYPMYAKASRAASEHPLGPIAGWFAAVAFGGVTLLAILPHVGVIFTSLSEVGAWYRSLIPTAWTLDHYERALTAPDSFQAISNSLIYSTAAMLLAVCFGLVVAYLIVRTNLPGRKTLDALCMLPLAVPGLVMAFGFVAMSRIWPMGREGPLGEMILGPTPNPVPLLVIAYAVRRLPYIVRSSVAGLEQTSGELEEAAVNLGASRVRAVVTIIIPLILANLIAGGLLVFAFSMLEVSDSMILAQQARHYPITKAIFAFMERLGDGPSIASAMGVWGMALLAVTLVGASMLLGKKLGAVFRA